MKHWRRHALVLVRGVLAAVAVFYAYRWLPELLQSSEDGPPLQWWAGRATGFVAYATLTIAMLFGLFISSRGLDGAVARRTVLEHHQQWTLASAIATVAHLLVIATDGYAKVGLRGVLLPGASEQLRGAVALGVLATWWLLLVALSSWLRAYLSYAAWRTLHASATAVFVLATAHAVFAGTDSGLPAVRALYVGSVSLVLAGVVFRVLYEPRPQRAPGTARAPAATVAGPAEPAARGRE